MACVDGEIDIIAFRNAIEELKEDITTLQKNIDIVESRIDSYERGEREYEGFDIERGLKHIELF